MPTSFSQADDATVALLSQTIAKFHPELKKHEVIIGVLIAANPDGPAVKHAGYAAAATIKVVPLKDRLTKGYDAELLIDNDHWKDCRKEHRVALLDHELSHLEVAKSKSGGVKLDDLGRPKLKLLPGDIVQSDGFREVVKRHGDYAPEVITLKKASAIMTDTGAVAI